MEQRRKKIRAELSAIPDGRIDAFLSWCETEKTRLQHNQPSARYEWRHVGLDRKQVCVASSGPSWEARVKALAVAASDANDLRAEADPETIGRRLQELKDAIPAVETEAVT